MSTALTSLAAGSSLFISLCFCDQYRVSKPQELHLKQSNLVFTLPIYTRSATNTPFQELNESRNARDVHWGAIG